MANLIRTEGPFHDLLDGTHFFTLYADDFIESSLNGLQNDFDQFRSITTRYYVLTVSSIGPFLFLITETVII